MKERTEPGAAKEPTAAERLLELNRETLLDLTDLEDAAATFAGNSILRGGE